MLYYDGAQSQFFQIIHFKLVVSGILCSMCVDLGFISSVYILGSRLF